MYKSIWLIRAIGIWMLNLNILAHGLIFGGLIIGGIFASKMWGGPIIGGGGGYLRNFMVSWMVACGSPAASG